MNQCGLPFDPKTANTSPEWIVRDTSLRITPVLILPTTLCMHELGSTYKDERFDVNSTIASIFKLLS